MGVGGRGQESILDKTMEIAFHRNVEETPTEADRPRSLYTSTKSVVHKPAHFGLGSRSDIPVLLLSVPFVSRSCVSTEWTKRMKEAGGTGDWQLFNLQGDPGEMDDLSGTRPEKRDAMLELWDEYVKANGVIVSDAGPYAKP